MTITTLIEYIPLQQGLRQLWDREKDDVKELIEYIPLQQGLRHIKDRDEFLRIKAH